MAPASRPGDARRRGALVVESQRREPWLGIEIRHFAALEALAGERSFHRAAARLGYTQGAVSQQLAALERAVGVKLVNRGGGSELTLTPAGKRLLVHVKTIRNRIQTAEQDLRAMALGSSGVLRLGVYQGIAPLLPRLLATFRTVGPDVRVAITDAPGDRELQKALQRDELDLAFVDMPVLPHPGLRVDELIRDEYVVVVAQNSRYFAGRSEIRPPDLRGVPLIAFKYLRSAELLLWSLRGSGVEPELLIRSDDTIILRAFANAGCGAALLPRLAVEPEARLRIIRLLDAHTVRRVGIAFSSSTSSTAVTGFIAAAHTVVKSFGSTNSDSRLEEAADETRSAV
jgi:DNA-binding transcriptional LysR family regulator